MMSSTTLYMIDKFLYDGHMIETLVDSGSKSETNPMLFWGFVLGIIVVGVIYCLFKGNN